MTSSTLATATPMSPAATEAGAISFPAGIPGFAAFRRYVIVDRDDLAPLRTLQAVDPAGPSFLVIDPRLIDEAFDCTLGDTDTALLDASPGDPLVWFALLTITAERAWVNLQAPVVVNARHMVGCQVIRADGRYQVQVPIGGC